MYKVTVYSKHSLPGTFQAIEEYYITNGMLYLRNTDDYAWYLPIESISEIQIIPYKEDKENRNETDN